MTNFMTRFASTFVAASIVLVPVAPAMARHHSYDRGYNYDQSRYYEDQNYDPRYDDQRNYQKRSRYHRGDRCTKGTGGLIIGAIAGGLLGREVVGRRGDRTAGAIIGAGAGALAGRAIDKSGGRRC